MASWIYNILSAIILLFICQFIVSVIRWYLRFKALRKKMDKLPGRNGSHWFWGDLKDFPGIGEAGIKWGLEFTKQFPKFHRFYFGAWRSNIVCTHPDSVKVILKTTEPKSMCGGGGYNLLIPWLGDGLLISKGDKWFRNRKLLTPGFHFDVLKPYMDIYNQAADTLINKWETMSKNGNSVEIYKHVCLCTLDVMLRCAFTYESDIQLKENEYVSTVNTLSKLIVDRVFQPWLYNNAYYLTPSGRKFLKLTSYAHEVAANIINKRKESLNHQKESQKKRYVDFLDILLLARDEKGNGLTDEEIRDEVDTFLFEGHDTTGSAISWILYALAKHPDIQQKCRDEIKEIIDRKGMPFIDWDSLQEMPYLTQCIKEGLRLYSPVPIISRDSTRELEIEGYTIPEGIVVDIVIYNVHHNPTVWGDGHDEYKPERFHPDNTLKMDSHAFIPFSAGPRNCIGQNFAMHEIKVVIARLLHAFELSVDKSHKVEMMHEIVTRPRDGIKLHFDKINCK